MRFYDEAMSFGFGALVGVSLMIPLLFFADLKREHEIKLQAIEKNAAYYHPKTGEFMWKESEHAESE